MNEIYEAPAVELVKVALEAGFQVSGEGGEGHDPGEGDGGGFPWPE